MNPKVLIAGIVAIIIILTKKRDSQEQQINNSEKIEIIDSQEQQIKNSNNSNNSNMVKIDNFNYKIIMIIGILLQIALIISMFLPCFRVVVTDEFDKLVSDDTYSISSFKFFMIVTIISIITMIYNLFRKKEKKKISFKVNSILCILMLPSLIYAEFCMTMQEDLIHESSFWPEITKYKIGYIYKVIMLIYLIYVYIVRKYLKDKLY